LHQLLLEISADSEGTLKMSPIKKFVFTFIAVVGIPALFFVLTEVALRLSGVGTHFDYFHEIDIDGKAYYQENKSFANQFYPPSLGIAPLNNTIEIDPDSSVVRVYILGGSAAQGFPHVNHGLDRHLSAHLRNALPGKKIEVINTAMTSVNSHVVYEVARTLPDESADFAIVLMGNNEVVGPYGPSTFSQNFLSSLTMIRALQALKRTRTWQAIALFIQQFKPSTDKKEMEWEGMEMFSEFNVTHDDKRLADVYSHYENNLNDIIDFLQRKNIHVILSSVPVNLRDSAPFGSSHRRNITSDELQRWKELNQTAKDAFTSANWTMAKDTYGALLEIDSEFADTHFKLAKVLENTRDFERARFHFDQALHYDTKRFRTNHVINDIIEQVASEELANSGTQTFTYVDSVTAFNSESEPFAPGWNLLHEHVHFDFDGNYVLAREFANAIVSQIMPSASYSSLTKDEAADIIGFPNHETNQIMNRLLSMVQKSPFTNQSNFNELKAFTEKRRDEIIDEVGSPADAILRRKPVVQKGLADWKIHYELAELNRFTGNQEASYIHLRELVKLYPHNHETYVKLAELESKKGQNKQAIQYLKRSLHYTRNDQTKETQALGLIGLNYMRANQYDDGKLYFEKIVDNYADQIGATIRAYGSLIKFAKDNNQSKDLNQHINGVQRYAKRLINDGRAEEFPLLYRRMAQIMTIAENKAEAERWQSLQP